MLDKELWRLGPVGPGVYWELRTNRTRGENKEKALHWIERTGEECPGLRGLEESPGWRELEESAKERDLVRVWSEKEG
ncbi:hypothetical protein TNCV_2666491 [Trichonephila clavipes]|nr:hypothetical protein TNCV_2666491 [Trichonephila clavipes]